MRAAAAYLVLVLPRISTTPIDFIETGTSDFATVAHKADGMAGISVDAVAHYLDRMPLALNVRRLHKFIALDTGQPSSKRVYYITSEDTAKYDLDYNLRGCSQADEAYLLLVAALKERGLEQLVRTADMQVIPATRHRDQCAECVFPQD